MGSTSAASLVLVLHFFVLNGGVARGTGGRGPCAGLGVPGLSWDDRAAQVLVMSPLALPCSKRSGRAGRRQRDTQNGRGAGGAQRDAQGRELCWARGCTRQRDAQGGELCGQQDPQGKELCGQQDAQGKELCGQQHPQGKELCGQQDAQGGELCGAAGCTRQRATKALVSVQHNCILFAAAHGYGLPQAYGYGLPQAHGYGLLRG
eukprot:100596-Chlamydomonas_euryale.AAC.1